MQKLILFIALTLTLANADDQLPPQVSYVQDYTYEDFERQFGRAYTGVERQNHKSAFDSNYASIKKLRSDPQVSFQVKVTEMADWTSGQQKEFSNFDASTSKISVDTPITQSELRYVALPAVFDYRQKGKVTPVKNQKGCGSSWAFVATSIYESALLIHGQGEYDLAEQAVLQCTMNGSCSGGYAKYALQNITQRGLPLESKFPYNEGDNAYASSICTSQSNIKLTNPIKSIKSYKGVLTTSQLKQYLYDNGPLGVPVRSNTPDFKFYGGGGVLNTCSSQGKVDHLVTLVGWNQQGWIIKNSWGTNWGDDGFAVIDFDNNCGITNWADVLEVEPTLASSSVIDTSDTNVAKYVVTMTDSFGDGWNGYFFVIKQGQSLVTSFGSDFTSGSSRGPQDLSIPNNKESTVVVGRTGAKSNEIGFSIKDAQGNQVCRRNQGSSFMSNIVFCSFCPNCTASTKASFEFRLSDSGNNGWENTILAFHQDGVLTQFGDSFTYGSHQGPKSVTLQKGLTTKIVVYNLGSNTNEIGYVIRDVSGNIVAERSAGDSFSADQVLSTFCTNCVNTESIQEASDELKVGAFVKDQMVTTYHKPPSNKGYIAAISILAILLVASVLVTCYLLYLKKLESQGKGPYDISPIMQSSTSIGSHGSIPVVMSSPGNLMTTE